MKEQKEEAEIFTEKQTQLSELRLQYFLYRLYHIDEEIDAELQLQEKDMEKKEDLESEERVMKAEVEEKKAAIGGKALEAKRAEKVNLVVVLH